MKDFALLIGNDINNIKPGKSWNELLDAITVYCGVGHINLQNKPFPMLYEEIFLSAVRNKEMDETDLKVYIAGMVAQIEQNEIHERIRALRVSHIMTTNYEFSIEAATPKSNSSLVVEKLYSVFRKHEMEDTTYWHIHGDCNNPVSINLGYEHYCGELQNIRNYTVSGTAYKTDGVVRTGLIQRLTKKEPVNYQSWIDLFFTKDIFIFGLALDFVESDLWWLLTFRARARYYKSKFKLNNTITYFIPKALAAMSTAKLELLKANDVQVSLIDATIGLPYYDAVLNRLAKL